MLKYLSNRNIAAFYLILMCVQILPIEGWSVSPLKVAAMCVAPLIIILKTPVVSKAMLFGGLYLLWVFFCTYLQWGNPRIETMGYLAMFVVMFMMFYNLLYSRAFTIDFAIKLLKYLIIAYGICQIGQQLCIIVGIRYFPLLNLVNQHYLSIFKVGSFSLEPSHSARILAVCFYALLKLTEYRYGYVLKLKELFSLYKWTIILFLYSMLTMGSGTAMVGLAILSLYFIKRQYLLFIVPLIAIVYISIPYINYEPLNRAKVIAEATMTGESENIMKADGSAAVRVTPLINTINNLDLTESDTWFGKGVDVARYYQKTEGIYSSNLKIGGITDYGLVSWLLSLVFVFSCCIRKVLSIETLFFLILLGLTAGNIAYTWGILMIFTVVRYFSINNSREGLDE